MLGYKHRIRKVMKHLSSLISTMTMVFKDSVLWNSMDFPYLNPPSIYLSFTQKTTK